MNENRSGAHVLNQKGALHILYIVGAHEPARFKDLQEHLSLTDPTIAKRLRELLDAGLIVRETQGDTGLRAEYTLSSSGADIYEHLVPVFEWAATRYRPKQRVTQF